MAQPGHRPGDDCGPGRLLHLVYPVDRRVLIVFTRAYAALQHACKQILALGPRHGSILGTKARVVYLDGGDSHQQVSAIIVESTTAILHSGK